MMTTIFSFLKFGSEENLTDLLRNGTIYMNSIQYFRQIEDGELRGDKYESVSSITNYPSGEFKIPEIGFKGNYHSIHLRSAYPEVLGNIYSLYCISSHGWSNPSEFKIDQKVKNFGSHCLMVKDNNQFLKLIENSLGKLGIKYRHDFIEYYNRQGISRKVNLFEKPMEFEYQMEFWIYVQRNSTGPFKFSIGNIESIAEIYPICDIVDGLVIGVKNKTAI